MIRCPAGQCWVSQSRARPDRARLARPAGESESKERLPNNVARPPVISFRRRSPVFYSVSCKQYRAPVAACRGPPAFGPRADRRVPSAFVVLLCVFAGV